MVKKKEEVKEEAVAPAKKPNIFSKIFKGGALTAGVVVVVVAAIALFVINFATGTPKTVVNNLINKGYKEAHESLKEVERLYKKFDIKKPVKGSFDITIESDMDELKDISGIKMSTEFGYDLDEKLITGSVAVENKEKFEAAMAIKEEDVYVKLLDEVIYLSEEAGIDSEYWEEIATIVEEYDIDWKQYETILKSLKNALQNSIDPKALDKSRDKISVDGKEISVNVVSFKLDEDSAQYFVKNMAKSLRKDKAFIKAIGELAEDYDIDYYDEDELIDALEELEDQADEIELDKDEKVTINIYTKGVFNKIVGGSVVYNKKEYVTYYNYGKNILLVVDDHVSDKLVVTGTRKGKQTDFVVKYNKEKIATATVRKWDKNTIDFDFSINYEDEKIKGSVYIDYKEGKKDISGTYKVSLDAGDEMNFKVKGSYAFEFDSDVSTFSTKNAVDAEDWDYEAFEEKLEEKLKKDEALQEIVKDMIEEYEDEAFDYNYLNMIVVDEDKAISLLSKEKATVLYVGSTYYSYYSEADARELLDSLTSVLDDKGIHAYYLADYNVYGDFEDAVANVKYTCEVSTDTTTTDDAEAQTDIKCDDYPAVYFIKDGKVVTALRGTADEDKIEAALKDIGL